MTELHVDIVMDDKYGTILPGPNNVFPTNTLDAIDHSIRKWEIVVEWLKEHGDERMNYPSTQSCALCVMYFHYVETDNEDEDNLKVSCEGCPVRDMSRRNGCFGTPWEKLVDARSNGEYANQLPWAQQELDYLKEVRREYLLTRPRECDAMVQCGMYAYRRCGEQYAGVTQLCDDHQAYYEAKYPQGWTNWYE